MGLLAGYLLRDKTSALTNLEIEYTFKNLLRNFPYCCENIDTECNGQRCIRCLFSFYCRAQSFVERTGLPERKTC